jgi:hypothetical protein
VTYFKQFIKDYRVTAANNALQATIRIPGERAQTVDTKIFTEDKDGNLDILVYTLDYDLITVDHPNATPEKPNIYNDRFDFYKVKRYAIPKEYPDKKTGETKTKKYDFPKGTGTHPFIPPAVCAKFHARQKIKTLVLTEGYKKAWYGALCGLDVIGLSSITHYKEKDTEAMYDDVLRIVKTCQVQNIILLHDGDCTDISAKALEQKTDLYTRPGGFFKAAIQCRELFKSFNDKIDFYFAHIRSEAHPDHPKGLDDLLMAFPDRHDKIVSDLGDFSARSTYFFRENITFQPNILVKHFAFNSPEIFYLRHADTIGAREFVYHGTSYKYDDKEAKLIKIRLREADDYFRVGDTYYKFVKIPNKYGQLERQFQVRQKGTITDDFGKPFLTDVQKYEAFCNIPSHTEFNMIVHNCFNVYSEFSHEPEAGSCDTSLDFVRHIFQEHYELGLDYIQLLYQKPTQILPILCLVSRENNTGKSTFVKWMKAIFTQNATVVGNDQFQDQFNASWATKLLITCEESFIEKKRVMEKIKQFSTGDKVPLRMMQKDPVEIDFFGKFVLCSNNEERFIIAESHDHRFWVRKIPVPPSDNVKMLDTLIQEIPAFLHYLNNRALSTQQESRMWFHHKLLITDAFRNLVEANKSTVEKELSEYVRNLFIESKEETIYAPINVIMSHFLAGKKFDETYVKRIISYMGIEQYTNESGNICTKRCCIPFVDPEGRVSYFNYLGRPYVFERRKFISDAELSAYSYDVVD